MASLRGGCLSRQDVLQIQAILMGDTDASEEKRTVLQNLVRRRISHERLGVSNNSILMAVLDRRIQEVAWNLQPADVVVKRETPTPVGFPSSPAAVPGGSPAAAGAGGTPVDEFELEPVSGAKAQRQRRTAARSMPLNSLVARCFNSAVVHLPERFDDTANSGDAVQCGAGPIGPEVMRICPFIRFDKHPKEKQFDVTGSLDADVGSPRDFSAALDLRSVVKPEARRSLTEV